MARKEGKGMALIDILLRSEGFAHSHKLMRDRHTSTMQPPSVGKVYLRNIWLRTKVKKISDMALHYYT